MQIVDLFEYYAREALQIARYFESKLNKSNDKEENLLENLSNIRIFAKIFQI